MNLSFKHIYVVFLEMVVFEDTGTPHQSKKAESAESQMPDARQVKATDPTDGFAGSRPP